MADRGHHSIGEVLSLLKDEFPDLTISKIRFLESQGLIDPERTPSGYRKFYDHDIDRLRWILTQQRDNFLPLKVMKHRILEAGFDPIADRPEADEPAPAPEPSLFRARRDAGPAPGASGDQPDEGVAATATRADPARVDTPRSDATRAVSPRSDTPRSDTSRAESPGSVSLTATELAAAAEVDAQLLSDLVRLGLIEGRDVDGDEVYDHEALIIARAAAAFSRRGMEARHLRMFKVAAEREAGVLGQLLAPLARREDGSAKTELEDLVELGETIHRAILRRLLAPHLG